MNGPMNENNKGGRGTSSLPPRIKVGGADLDATSVFQAGMSTGSSGMETQSSTESKNKQMPYVHDFRGDFKNLLQDLVQDVQSLSTVSPGAWEYYRRDGCCETWLNNNCDSDKGHHQVRLSRLIGQGSFGKVYYGAVDGQHRAIKCIRATWQDLKILISEAEMGCSVCHPNVVKTFGYVVSNIENQLDRLPSALTQALMNARIQHDEDEYFYIQMIQEYCECGSLECHIGSSESLFEGSSLSRGACVALILRDIAQALVYLHDHGILHGDLSGNNVLFVRDNTSPLGIRAKVGDFGRSRVCLAEKMKTDSLGTANFMPPELLLSGDLSVKIDVYALGILGLEMWTGKKAWNGVLPVQIMYAMSLGKRVTVPEEMQGELGDFLRSCLCDNPMDRPTPQQALETLQTMITSQGQDICTPYSQSQSSGESDSDAMNNSYDAE